MLPITLSEKATCAVNKSKKNLTIRKKLPKQVDIQRNSKE